MLEEEEAERRETRANVASVEAPDTMHVLAHAAHIHLYCVLKPSFQGHKQGTSRSERNTTRGNVGRSLSDSRITISERGPHG